jgi:hypothetical protein
MAYEYNYVLSIYLHVKNGNKIRLCRLEFIYKCVCIDTYYYYYYPINPKYKQWLYVFYAEK